MKNKTGFTLIEMLVYIAILIITLNFVFQIYYGSFGIIKRSNVYAEYLEDVQCFSDIFASDVRNASKILPDFKDFKTSRDTLVLMNPDSVMVYKFYREKKVIIKLNICDENITRQGQWFFSNVRFVYDVSSPDVIRVYVLPDNDGKIFKNREFFLCVRNRNES